MSQLCGVCGLSSDEAVCPRCHTILLAAEAACPTCGKPYPGAVAECDRCGPSLTAPPNGPDTEEAIRLLASVPGISPVQAKQLVSNGFHDFADLVRLTLPESQVRKGLHHAIARRALLSNLPAAETPAAEEQNCPVCGGPWSAEERRCVVCGSEPSLDPDLASIEERLQTITGELLNLAENQDFQQMPPEVREEFIEAFGGLPPAQDLVREGYRRQIEAWRAKGFDVASAERLLDEDPKAFREKGVRLIRAQSRKKVVEGAYHCPLCEASLEAAAEDCDNCGAKFV